MKEIKEPESEEQCPASKIEIRDRIQEDRQLMRDAEKSSRNAKVKRDFDHLEEQLAKGNKYPGLWPKYLGNGIFEED